MCDKLQTVPSGLTRWLSTSSPTSHLSFLLLHCPRLRKMFLWMYIHYSMAEMCCRRCHKVHLWKPCLHQVAQMQPLSSCLLSMNNKKEYSDVKVQSAVWAYIEWLTAFLWISCMVCIEPHGHTILWLCEYVSFLIRHVYFKKMLTCDVLQVGCKARYVPEVDGFVLAFVSAGLVRTIFNWSWPNLDFTGVDWGSPANACSLRLYCSSSSGTSTSSADCADSAIAAGVQTFQKNNINLCIVDYKNVIHVINT